MGCLHRNDSAVTIAPVAKPSGLTTRPFKPLSRAERKKIRTQAPLELTLRTEGIAPFNTGLADADKKFRLLKLRHPQPQQITEREPYWLLVAIGICTLFLGGIFFDVVMMILGLGVAAASLYGKKTSVTVQDRPDRYSDWQVRSIQFFRTSEHNGVKLISKIPWEIQVLAVRIERSCPGAVLMVENLREDHFLLAQHCDPDTRRIEKFYIAFWNEDESIIPSS